MIDPVKISNALSHPIRYKIMLMLVNHYHRETKQCCFVNIEGVCNCEIMAEFGMIQSRVSYHMKELTKAELVIEKPCGKWKYYIPNIVTIKRYIYQLGLDLDIHATDSDTNKN
ncbi:MAG: Bacterial regulatory protein, arsR family [Pelotomaculum sp. PtaB.Bin104]|nr:MAG: Bacterial regulatory protein, arsR family [Pelotomaculum sp. PtaB.Bin104]